MNTFHIIRTDRNADASALAGASLLIGRAHTNDLQLPHPAVAATHAGIKWHAAAFWLSALAADAPVLLNGAAVRHAPLREGDTVRLGPYLLRLAVSQETLQITVDFALGLALAGPLASAPASFAGTPDDEQVLAKFWEHRLSTTSSEFARNQLPQQQPQPLTEKVGIRSRRGPLRLLAASVVILLLGVAVAAWAFPQVYAPGPLSAAHAAKTLPAASNPIASGASPIANPIASRASASCGACHTLRGTMPQQCSACHSTPVFQAAIAAQHLKLGLTCRACHTEHRGAEFKPAFVGNAVCANCHNQTGGQPLHGPPVSYPLRNGLWLWDGVSQTAWQQHGLPGRTVDYNLREQFHLLHTQGAAPGRAQCVDCHLGGTEGAALKRNVRESCAQCHGLQPAFAAALAKLAETQPLSSGPARCVSCHAQHGAEKDLRVSARK